MEKKYTEMNRRFFAIIRSINERKYKDKYKDKDKDKENNFTMYITNYNNYIKIIIIFLYQNVHYK